MTAKYILSIDRQLQESPQELSHKLHCPEKKGKKIRLVRSSLGLQKTTVHRQFLAYLEAQVVSRNLGGLLTSWAKLSLQDISGLTSASVVYV